MYLASLDYVDAARELFSFHGGHLVVVVVVVVDEDVDLKSRIKCNAVFKKDSDAHIRKLEETIQRMKMLCGLYFPEENMKFETYGLDSLPYVSATRHGHAIKSDALTSTLTKTKKNIDTAEASLTALCNKLMISSR